MSSSSESTAISKPRWERRKEARPAELVASALELFVEKGYAGTRLDDVAAHAGVSKGTLYLYFENKEDLFKAVVRDNVVARISETAGEVMRFDGSSSELLHFLISGWWRDYGDSKAGGLGKLIMAESGNFPEIARFFVEEVIEPWHEVLAAAISRGIERGEFRPVDPAMFVRVMSAPLVMLSLWKRSFGPCSQQPIDADNYLATHIDMVLSALRKA
jgi:AcrR family transcriptional regulator